jgi:hypothetical protein
MIVAFCWLSPRVSGGPGSPYKEETIGAAPHL